jgi:hypothetical protein
MITEKLNRKELFVSLDETTSELVKVVSAFNEQEINTTPFKDSWTAAQVADHVNKSNKSMIKSLSEEGKPSGRNGDEDVAKLREIFLNFDSKLQSPKFILPTQETYNKEALVTDLKNAVERIKELSKSVELPEMVNHPVFGEITKFEILHFIVYHTQRHIHQLKNISQTVAKR